MKEKKRTKKKRRVAKWRWIGWEKWEKECELLKKGQHDYLLVDDKGNEKLGSEKTKQNKMEWNDLGAKKNYLCDWS